MNEDYLWDKTGAPDAEIERLEKSLAAFRYQPTEPPALPAKILAFEPKPLKKLFRLIYAFAACAALVIVSLGVWFQFDERKIEVVKSSTDKIAPEIVEKNSIETPVVKSNDFAVKKSEDPKQFVKSDSVKIKKVVSANVRQKKLTTQKIRTEKPSVELTSEEKYAYDQLMLALSITSSKLKLVKNKVEGDGEQNADLENGR